LPANTAGVVLALVPAARIGRVAYLGIVGVRVAVVAVELPARGYLTPVTVGLYIAAAIVDRSLAEAEHAHVTVSRKARLVGEPRRVDPVAVQTIEGALEVGGDLAR